MFIEAFGHGVRRNGRLSRALTSILENGTTMLLIYIRISRGLTFPQIWLMELRSFDEREVSMGLRNGFVKLLM